MEKTLILNLLTCWENLQTGKNFYFLRKLLNSTAFQTRSVCERCCLLTSVLCTRPTYSLLRYYHCSTIQLTNTTQTQTLAKGGRGAHSEGLTKILAKLLFINFPKKSKFLFISFSRIFASCENY